jgi:hypothetical protein
VERVRGDIAAAKREGDPFFGTEGHETREGKVRVAVQLSPGLTTRRGITGVCTAMLSRPEDRSEPPISSRISAGGDGETNPARRDIEPPVTPAFKPNVAESGER